MGDLSLELNNPVVLDFLNEYGFTNLIKRITSFKGDRSCIDLILSDYKYSFKFSTTFEAGLSDHHHLIHSMFKTTFQIEEAKILFTVILNTFTHTYFNYT